MCIPLRSWAPRCASHRGVKLSGVHPTTESSSVVCITPQSQGHQMSQKTSLCASNRRVRLHSVLPTAESDSAVCITQRSQAPLCASHHGVKLRGAHHTEESNCTPRSLNRSLCEGLVAFKGTIRRNPFRVNTYIVIEKILGKKFWFAKPKILTPRCDAHRGVEFFELSDRISRQNRNRIRKTLACLSGAQMGLNHEKKLEVENFVTHSL